MISKNSCTFFDHTNVHGATCSNTMATPSLATTMLVTPLTDYQQMQRYEGVTLTPGYKEIRTCMDDMRAQLLLRKGSGLLTFTFANWTASVVGPQSMHAVLVAIRQRATLLAFANFAACFVEPETMRAILVTACECGTVM
jgi:hypothetical protein